MIQIVYNKEKNGIELHFPGKPDAAVLAELRVSDFRYHGGGRYWYAKRTPENEAFAQHIAGSTPDASMPEEPQPTETQPDASQPDAAPTPYFPPFDVVNGTSIFRTAAEVSPHREHDGYFADIQAYIRHNHYSVTITDLTNALLPGKKCAYVTVSTNNDAMNVLTVNDIKTYAEAYQRFFVERTVAPGCSLHTGERASIRTFTPFRQIKPIKTPAKWTLAHVWKAILAGQAYMGRVDGKYTDDYAGDAATNCRKGSGVHLPSFAKQLIQEPSGWYVSPDKEQDGIIPLSVNCFSFDCRTVYFDAKCDWPENERRRIARVNELETYNNGLLAQAITIDEGTLQADACYDIQYLEKDQNTKRYEIKSALIQSFRIMEGEYHCCSIISCERHAIVPIDMYVVASFNDRFNTEDTSDARLIILGDMEVYLTGHALAELLAEGRHFSTLSQAKKTAAQVAEDLQAHLTGQRMVMFSPRANYSHSLACLQAEMQRATPSVRAENVLPMRKRLSASHKT